MLKQFLTGLLLCVSQLAVAQQPAEQPSEPQLVHHSLRVVLDPSNQQITVEDTITLPDSMSATELDFTLNNNLRITNNSGDLQLLQSSQETSSVGINNTHGVASDLAIYPLRGKFPSPANPCSRLEY